jgi:DNA-binding LytR/AlgR family response regulator
VRGAFLPYIDSIVMADNKISCVIVEDDLVAQKVLEVLIQKTSFLNLKKSFADPIEASAYLKSERVDLIFLDVEMPGINGLELIDLLDYKPSIIMVTAQKQYAVQAFEQNVLDYLVKPVNDYSRFLKAALKAKEVKDAKKQADVPQKTDNPPLFVKVDSLLHNINLNSILWIEAYGDYVKINTDQKMLMILSTLKGIEGKLPENQFVRVHRSFIVNIKRIDNIDPANLQIGTKIIPISATHREALINKINLL